MTEVISWLMNTIMLGSTYTIVALGIVLIFSVLDVMSLAQGQILVASGYVGFVLVLGGTGNLLLAMLATLVAGFVFGVIVERIAVRPSASGGHMATLVTTVGAGMIILNITILVAGPYQHGVDKGGLSHRLGTVAGVPITWAEVITVASVVLGVAIVQYVTKRTAAGRVIRAAAENPRIAAVFGVNISRVRTLTFAAGSALAGLGAVMLVLRYGYISPEISTAFMLMALTVVLLGGVGQIMGAALAAFLLALIQVGAITYIGPGYSDVIAFGSLFLILLVRPEGLFAQLERRGG